MAKRNKEQALQTRERILDAAALVFHERGVARPSLSEVAALAGVTRGAVYGHFHNKADLFNSLCDRIRLPTETLVGQDIAAADPLNGLREHWTGLFHQAATVSEVRMILETIFHRCELVTESGEIRERMLRGRNDGNERVTTLLQAAVSCGQLPADLDVTLAAPMLHGALIGVLQDWLLQPDYDLVAIGSRYIEAMIDMLRLSPSLRLRGDS